MPRVTSALLARHEAHVLDGLGAMGTPHMQQRTSTMVPPTAAPGGSIGSSMVASACLANCFFAGRNERIGWCRSEGNASGTTWKKHRRQMQCAKFIHSTHNRYYRATASQEAEGADVFFIIFVTIAPPCIPSDHTGAFNCWLCVHRGLIVPQPQVTRYNCRSRD